MKNFLRVFSLSLLPVIFLFSLKSYAEEITKKYDYKDFDRIATSYGMHIKVTQSDSYSIEVKADERDFRYFKAEQDGDKVSFYIDKNNYRKKDDIYITVTMPKLTELKLSGGSIADIKMDIKEDFAAKMSGGSGLGGNLKCGNVSFDLSGGSHTDLNGSGKSLEADGSGGSTFKLSRFAVNEADLDLSGGSEAEVKVNGKLSTTQSGGSRVKYSGNTIVEKTNLSGGSKVIKED